MLPTLISLQLQIESEMTFNGESPYILRDSVLIDV